MPAPELEKYIKTAREKKIDDAKIREMLLKTGWSEKDVNEALVPAISDPEVPPPPAPHFGMWVAFKYIILFICLYVSFTALGGIMHRAVNDFIPDKLDKATGYFDYFDDFLMKAYISSIVVAFPIFAGLFLLLKKEALERPAVKNLRARKILIYITLIGTFLILIGHLISTIYGFLGGTTTLRSFAHLLVTFLVAGSVFVYLLLEVREDRKTA